MTLLEMSLTGSVMIIVVFLVRSLLLHRLPKKTFVIMWGIVVLRLLVPVQIASRWSIYSMLPETWTESWQGGVIGELFAAVSADAPWSMRDGNSAEGSFADDNAVANPVDTIDTEIGNLNLENMGDDLAGMKHMDKDRAGMDPAETDRSQGDIWKRRFLSGMGVRAIVRAGSLLCAGWFVAVYWISRRRFAESLPVQDPNVDRFLAEHKLRRKISVRRISGIQTPLTYGIWHPVILFPDKTDWTNTAELEFMLTHEYVHIRHFDALFKLILTAAFCVHWFNPFVWLLYLQCSRDIELSCDETVVRISGGHSQSNYAMTLIAMAERRSVSVPISSGFSRNALEERIEAIMLMKRLSLQIGIVAVLLVAVMTVLFATSGERRESPGVNPEDAVAAAQTARRAEADKINESDRPDGENEVDKAAPENLMDEPDYSIKYFQEGMPEEIPAVPVVGNGYSMLFPADERLVSNDPMGFVHSENEHIYMRVLMYEGMDVQEAGALLSKSGYQQMENGDYRIQTGEGDAVCAEIIRLVEDVYSTYGLSYGFPDNSEYEEGWGTILAAAASTFTLNTAGLNADGEALKEAAKAFGDAYLTGDGAACLKYMSAQADTSSVQELKRGEFGFAGAWAKRLCMGTVEELSEGDETGLQIECGNPAEGEGNVYLGITFRKEEGAMRVVSFGWEG